MKYTIAVITQKAVGRYRTIHTTTRTTERVTKMLAITLMFKHNLPVPPHSSCSRSRLLLLLQNQHYRLPTKTHARASAEVESVDA